MNTKTKRQNRLSLFNTLRGVSVISMMCFRDTYDLRYIFGLSLPWFSPLIDIWHASIFWAFLFIAGVMCACSRNNSHRSLRYLLVAFF
jgi:uncharacterized membrane protein